MSRDVVPTAKDINEAHKLARTSAETAVEHAIRCGKMLLARKRSIERGQFEQWVAQHCQFSYRSARAYMQAARKPTNGSALPFSSLRKALESGSSDKPKEPKKLSAPHTPETARAAENTSGESAPEVKAPKAAKQAKPKATRPPGPASPIYTDDELKTIATEHEAATDPAMPTAEEMAEMDAAIDQEYSASIAKVMEADDKLAAANAEIKRQAAEIATLKCSRDGFMNGKEAVMKLLKAEQRKTERLEKKLQAADDQLTALRERIAIMEAA